jgi:starch phosphorylase
MNPELERPVLYLTIEIALDTALPTYSGGLGVLAGDHVRSAADLGLELTAVSLWYRQGYGLQSFDENNEQVLRFPSVEPGKVLEETGITFELELGDDTVAVNVYRKRIPGMEGEVSVYFLDAGLAENPPEWQACSGQLYGGDSAHRLRQEMLLGFGAMALAKALGLAKDCRVHLNEGHCAMAAVAVLEAEGGPEIGLSACKERCRFTTHTPVAAGHDVFDFDLVKAVTGQAFSHKIQGILKSACPENTHAQTLTVLNMSWLAACLSGKVNGVSELNGEIAETLFPPGLIPEGVRFVTNGVHLATWCVDPMLALLDDWLSGWRSDPELLEQAEEAIPDASLIAARVVAKADLIERINADCLAGFDLQLPLIGFARRMTGYKRANLVFSDLQRLKAIAERFGGLQLVFSGRAHPKDVEGQALLRQIREIADLGDANLRVAVLSNYSMRLGRMLTGGVDIWLNNPVRPLEASGTSGMKASLQGVPNLSIPDGWWVEGCEHGVNGWAFGEGVDLATGAWPDPPPRNDKDDAESLYQILETTVLPMITDADPGPWCTLRKGAIASAAQFASRRMVRDYVAHIY